MSTNEKKPQPVPGQTPASSPPPSTSPPSTTPRTTTPPPSPPKPVTGRGPMVSRRTFLLAAVGASAALATAPFAFANSPGGILNPLIPTPMGETKITSVAELASSANVVSGPLGDMPWMTFYWPYQQSVSPYYKNFLCRVPDGLRDQVTIPSSAVDADGHKYVAYNATCVHLQCLVNPGFADNQYRLQCPCHGSQYEIQDAVPVRGPAFLLNLGRLPRIRLSIKSGQIYAEDWDSSRTLEGTPGLGISGK